MPEPFQRFGPLPACCRRVYLSPDQNKVAIPSTIQTKRRPAASADHKPVVPEACPQQPRSWHRRPPRCETVGPSARLSTIWLETRKSLGQIGGQLASCARHSRPVHVSPISPLLHCLLTLAGTPPRATARELYIFEQKDNRSVPLILPLKSCHPERVCGGCRRCTPCDSLHNSCGLYAGIDTVVASVAVIRNQIGVGVSTGLELYDEQLRPRVRHQLIDLGSASTCRPLGARACPTEGHLLNTTWR